MPETIPLVDVAGHLADVAAQTIRNHRRAIEKGAGHLRSITVEIEVKRTGEVVDSRTWVEHRGAHRVRTPKADAGQVPT